ncbi:hypothetical protein [Saccharospirillum mangrovi]|uniref:hypothetical protein n=1 Tax=Saccharospirillum mangrovi TaxID=2161747 RepID=UPI00130055D4|nr:hypothetical protein [Saccharospirillum mangrovi]
MDVVILVSIYLAISGLAIFPAILFWGLSSLWLPDWFSLPPIRMALICLALSVATALVFNFELSGGVLSVGPFVVVLSLAWSLFLFPVLVLIRYRRYAKAKHS